MQGYGCEGERGFAPGGPGDGADAEGVLPVHEDDVRVGLVGRHAGRAGAADDLLQGVKQQAR